MSVKDTITNKIKNLLKDKRYVPRFEIGDVVFNKKYRIISKIVGIRSDVEHLENLLNKKLDYQEQGINTAYAMKDLLNDNRDVKYINKHRHREAIKIDAYYEKIDERAALVLYGKGK